MAEMKYVYEYCAAFQDEVEETRRKVAGADACESITGYSSFEKFVRGLAEDWRDFPDRWPWL